MKKEITDLELLRLTIESREDLIKKLMEERDYWRWEAEKTKKEFEQYKQNYNVEKDKQRIFLMTWRRY